MGSWFAVRSGIGYTYAAIADTVEQDTREKFKCLVSFSIVNLVDFVSAPYQTRLFLFNDSTPSAAEERWQGFWPLHGTYDF